MTVEQIYQVANAVTQEVLGETAVVNEDLSNIVDIGSEITGAATVDRYVKSLIDHIGKMVFVNRTYSSTTPSVLMDSWEYGAIMEKVQYEGLPEATENESWELTDGQVYEQDEFYQPQVSAKFFNKKTTFETQMSFAERQCKSCWDNVSQLNSFFSMIETAIQTSMTVKTDALIERVINHAMGSVLNSGTSLQKINLLADYNTAYSKSLTFPACMYDADFIRYCAYTMTLWSDRLTKISTLFNTGGKVRFTPKDRQHFIMLAEFADAADVYLQSDVYHNEYVKLPKAEKIPYWQGSGTTYAPTSTSAINVKVKTESSSATVSQTGIIGTIFDRYALGVTNIDRRVTSHYNAKAEFYNNWYKADAGYFNDMNENMIVFYCDDSE